MGRKLFFATTLSTFLCLTGIDFMVHFVLYHFGLTFDVTWADPYWMLLTLSFLSISLLSSATYLMNGKGNWRTAVLIFLTVFGLYQAGLLDILWILLWAALSFQDPYILTNVWWWSPYYRYLAVEWRVQHQLALLSITATLLGLAWIKANRSGKEVGNSRNTIFTFRYFRRRLQSMISSSLLFFRLEPEK